jgi:hypothetical protein
MIYFFSLEISIIEARSPRRRFALRMEGSHRTDRMISVLLS